jgi:tRNA pseudouridine-54 N-methylase
MIRAVILKKFCALNCLNRCLCAYIYLALYEQVKIYLVLHGTSKTEYVLYFRGSVSDEGD